MNNYDLNKVIANGFGKSDLFPFDLNKVDNSECLGQTPRVENQSPAAEKSNI